VFIQIDPPTFNALHDADPDGFTSCNNLFQSMDTKMNRNNNRDNIIGEVNHLVAPPVTECLVDANIPGGLYEQMATTGGLIEKGGTTVVPIAHKQDFMAENSTEADIDAAAYLGKILRWLVLFMSNFGLPFQGPI
jgi:hypothetical protein